MRKRKHWNVLNVILIIGFSLLTACGSDPNPKPKGFLRLEYPEAQYKHEDLNVPFTFETNLFSENVKVKEIQAPTESFGINIEYPKLKGTIYLTYKSIDNNEKYLINFLRDAQNFTQEHTKKADEIVEQPFEDEKRKAYGMLYEVGGNAASQSQFYVTDSINHFLVGSLYFYAKPNYDSILPAANYLQKDIRRIMETIEWK